MMQQLLSNISKCQLCASTLGHQPRPVLQASKNSKLIIIGQAPGAVVHKTGVPWDDKSGDNLRSWMGMSKEVFYNAEKVALVPMGFCYPGKGSSGDLPPRKECAPKWHEELFNNMQNVELTLLIGKYAQDYYLKNAKPNLTQTVKNFQEYLPQHLVLPHPSPRNNIWQAKNPWFSQEVLPVLKQIIKDLLGT